MEQSIVISLEKRYPGLGIKDIISLVNLIRERSNLEKHGQNKFELTPDNVRDRDIPYIDEVDSTVENEETSYIQFDEKDRKWRPILLTVGLMYKLQKVLDDPWYDASNIFIKEESTKMNLVRTFAWYWHYLLKVAWALVLHTKCDQDLIQNLAESLKIEEKQIVFSLMKDSDILDDHSPDIMLIVHHERKEVILTICGTKITPHPSAADIMLDLHAQATPFHQGKAHEGIALACNTILRLVMHSLITTLNQYSHYNLVILGYSLGAGVAQLVTLRLSDGPESQQIPRTVDIFGICYGSPPVYKSSVRGFSHPNIYCVINHNDGLPTLSVHTLTKTFLQIRAIDRLKLKRRKVLKLLRTRIGNTATQEDGTRTFVCDTKVVEEGGWKKLIDTMNLIQTTGFAELNLVAKNVFLIKRSSEDQFTIRHLTGLEETENLTSGMKLRMGVFNDHMPWGYGSLFKDYGEVSRNCSLDVLNLFK